ncbi:hypothetical protein FOL47_009903 [Perkinsus chesapeaki]|uniref:EF-hand domain-containing protein n=1 Tax=Perkinsus chesapeaki TaxID=330153 RepID=A0A7J6L5V1_PERCH|nr:hypothetical protein FOL47_009903 [Perkinsus chesapeaki]
MSFCEAADIAFAAVRFEERSFGGSRFPEESESPCSGSKPVLLANLLLPFSTLGRYKFGQNMSEKILRGLAQNLAAKVRFFGRCQFVIEPDTALAARAAGTAELPDASFQDDVEALALTNSLRSSQRRCGVGDFSVDDCEDAFNQVDLDVNGYIDAEEIRAALARICGRSQSVKDEEILEMIRMLDSTGYGRVSKIEFMRALCDPENMITKEASKLLAEQNRKEELARSYHRQQVENKAAVATAFEGKKGQTKNATKDNGKPNVKKATSRPTSFPAELHSKTAVAPPAAMSGMEDAEGGYRGRRASLVAMEELSGRFDRATAEFILERDGSAQMEGIFKIIDTDQSGSVDVREFLIGICNFTDITGIDKVKFAFMLFDEDGSGYIDKEELVKIIRANLAGSHGPKMPQLERRLRAVFTAAGPNAAREQKLRLQDLINVCRSNPGLLFPPAQAKQIADSIDMP